MTSVITGVLGLIAGIVVAVAYPYHAVAINNVVMHVLSNVKEIILHVMS